MIVRGGMTAAFRCITFLCLVVAGYPSLGMAGETRARIYKVLAHFVDSKGRHSLSPSLYERDAYQAELRRHPERISGMRFDVNWRVRNASEPIRLRLELR